MVTGTSGPCVGNIAPIYRLGFNGLCLQDGPLAIRQADYASVFPAGVTCAASWDRNLIHTRGVFMGTEFKGKGANMALGPVSGPLGRSAYDGRNWEGFSPDPYLTGTAMEETISGMQSQGLQACAKHYIGYEQETQRNPSETLSGETIEAISSNIDDRTIHELYLWPFANAVKAGTASIMCSYNRINSSYGCQNSKALNGLLKEELGFQGFVVSDWEATHSGVSAILAGLDMDMPGGIGFTAPTPSFFGGNVSTSVNNGSVPESRVDDMINRIMTPYFYLHQDTGYPSIDPSEGGLNFFPTSSYLYNFTSTPPANRDVRDDHAALIRELGAAGTVLLKNTNGTLPLKAPKNVGVFGNDAGDISSGLYFEGDYEQGTLPVGGGSGTGRLSYVVPPLDAIKTRVGYKKNLVQYQLNNTILASGDISSIYPTPPDVCLVFLKTWAEEGLDRTSLENDWNSTAVVNTVAGSCNNTIVIYHSSGINVLPWASHPNVTGILAAHYPGQESGNSIVDILWGDYNPSGKLPYTIAYNESDYNFAPITNSSALLNTTDPNAWQSDFAERLLIDYKHFDYYNESVQYEFGFGLSYTTFSMGNLSISGSSAASGYGSGSSISSLPPPVSNGTPPPGGNPALWDTLFTTTATVTNTGSVAGAAVPQLYVSLPASAGSGTPVRQLRGFDKVTLQPGQSAQVHFPLMRRDLSFWDVEVQEWRIPAGTIGLEAGFSSRDLRASANIST
ncbi:glycoside hydrolase family 3 protein [Viridothelium virens]|uniref:beta-glucosidase n=1 Tax=Viridothelium virens TaxID=1048519 RepID=A0A6A6H919_VIRVR|nr:glycoside hydrolase family 3 protein [Viridothelium virens]